VLSALEIYTGKIILRPSQLPTAPGGYNLKIPNPIPKSQAILYIETILAMNNIAVVPMGNDALKIVQLPSARIEAPELILGSTLDMPPSSKVASKLFQLDFLRVQEFQQMMQNVVNPAFGAATPLANANAILITDSISNLQRVEMLLQQVDKPSMGGMSPKFYQLHFAKASDLVGKLHSILTGTVQQQLGMGTTYNADDRTNQLILITDPRQFPFFDDLIARLDTKSDPNTRNEVIYLKHAKASDVVAVLIKIISGQNQVTQKSQSARPVQATNPGAVPAAPAPAPVGPLSGTGSVSGGDAGTSEFSSLVTVVNDDRSNSIVVSGTVDDIRLMKNLIDQLDNVLPQVRIEVVIAEVTLDDNHQSGISQLGLQVEGNKLTGFAFSGGASGYPVSVGGLGNATMAAITRNNGNISLAGIISVGTTPRKTNTTVLSVPTITTSHAKEAKFLSTIRQPIITSTLQSATGVTTGLSTSQQVTQEDIGITLTVTPLIGGDGSIQMDVDADVQDIAGYLSVNGVDQPIVSHRETKSTITAHTGDIIVVGGMQRNKDSLGTNRLGPIPIIGDLFGARKRSKERTELIFFLRGFVLTNTEADNASAIKRVEQLPARDVPQRDDIMKQFNPNYVPPKKSVLDKILPK
jgi:general secretion pathway protein D